MQRVTGRLPQWYASMKIMTSGMKDAKGTSMLEDYTYNLVPGKEGILEAHMLEICPSIADGPISIKCQPLSMGDREDPARLVFTSKEGTGIATSLVDLGDRFRLLINTVDCKKVEKPMPKLPVATNFWTPQPDLITGAEAWILSRRCSSYSIHLRPHSRADGRLGRSNGNRACLHRQRDNHSQSEEGSDAGKSCI